MQNKKRQALTILEVMIAMSLTAILLSFTFLHLRKMLLLRPQLEKAQREVSQRTYLYMRLSQVFAKIEKELPGNKEPLFQCDFEEEASFPRLEFIYYQGADPDPLFCGWAKAKLYLSAERQLIFSYEPLDKEKISPREEPLMDDIEAIAFSFLDPDKLTYPSKKVTEPLWPKEKEKFPYWMILTIKKGEEEISWPFFFYTLTDKPLLFEK